MPAECYNAVSIHAGSEESGILRRDIKWQKNVVQVWGAAATLPVSTQTRTALPVIEDSGLRVTYNA